MSCTEPSSLAMLNVSAGSGHSLVERDVGSLLRETRAAFVSFPKVPSCLNNPVWSFNFPRKILHIDMRLGTWKKYTMRLFPGPLTSLRDILSLVQQKSWKTGSN
eukprot:GHVT01069004.1.p2 GENE.GHVT01069004.1~~GHVT01069004.1.p2  ORF type:complete len:104 (-),score=0.95 GHVT01069004.1:566-877(-)